jgi:hypothetical protein
MEYDSLDKVKTNLLIGIDKNKKFNFMFFVSKQVRVKIFCLISDKQKHADDIKDFSQLDLSKFEKLTLPWVSDEEPDFLEIVSID